MNPRRLTFAVSTSLLSASLVVAPGCGKKYVNTGPQPPAPEETVNEGPVEEPSELEEPSAEEAPAEADAEAPAPEAEVDEPAAPE